MLIYGSRAAHVNSGNLSITKCPNCGTEGSINVSVFSKHAHIFWIPLFPMGKEAVSQCQNCKQVLHEAEMSQEIKSATNSLKTESKTPKWQFSGLALIALIIIWGKFQGDKDSEERKTFLANPKIGDIYEVSTENGYSTFKIAELAKDTIWVNQNQYEINKSTKIHTIDKDENYLPIVVGMSKKELQNNFKAGKILDINRK